jgi:hypothetical protein
METTVNDILVYVGFGLLLVALVIFLYRKDVAYLFRKQETEGVIVNWMAATEKGVKYFYPMIEFSPDGLTQKTFRAEERCEGQPLYPPGTKVKIFYLPTDPEHRKVIYPS